MQGFKDFLLEKRMNVTITDSVQVSITVTAAGSEVENQNVDLNYGPDLVLNDEQTQLLIELRDSLGKPTAETESYLTIDNKGNHSGRQTKRCTNDSCPVDVHSDTAIVLHRHVNTDSRSKSRNVELTKTREFPGPGDHGPLRVDVINAFITPQGALRVVERVNGSPRVRTIYGGTEKWNKFIEKHWYPNMDKAAQQQIIKENGL